MDLFVINRHEGDDQPVSQTKDDEDRRLKKILKRAEKRKKIKEKQLVQKEKVSHAIQKKLRRKEIKANIVHVPENNEDEFIDPHLKEAQEKEENEKKDKQNKDISKILEGFTVLGGENFNKKEKVKRVLPKWLAQPTVIPANLQNLHSKVSHMKCLDKSLRKRLKANGIKNFFPVQSEVIPWLIEQNRISSTVIPQDVCVSAPTGSGKTLAYVLPIVQELKKYPMKLIFALIILPTQDLAVQVYKTFKEYTRDTGLTVSLATGSVPLDVEQKKLVVEYEGFGFVPNVDILVCTPGRLVDHLNHTKGFKLHHLKFLVIDEADRVLDTIQNAWLYHLEKHIHTHTLHQGNVVFNLYTLQKPRPPQRLLFSATLSQDPEKLQQLALFQPKLFTCIAEPTEKSSTNETEEKSNEETKSAFVGKFTMPSELTEKYVVCSMDLKPLVLYKLIENENLRKTLIFAHSAEAVHRLTILLKSLFGEQRKVEEISSNFQLKIRNTILKNFSDGIVDLLVCTDSLARGMDFAGVECVVSYSAPKYLKTYIHRAGRTARAGASGLTVTMLHDSQVSHFMSMLKQAGKDNIAEIKVAEDELEELAKQYEEALNNLKQTILTEKKTYLKKIKRTKRKANLKRKRNDSVASSKSQQ